MVGWLVVVPLLFVSPLLCKFGVYSTVHIYSAFRCIVREFVGKLYSFIVPRTLNAKIH